MLHFAITQQNSAPCGGRLRRTLLLALLASLPRVLCAGTILTPISVTIPTQNLYTMFILCTVPIGSCDASSPIPLIRVEFDAGSLPPFSGQADINNVNTAIVKSGYITWIAQDPAAPDHVVIGLRNGLVSTGDPWPFATPESQLAADLLASDASLLYADCRTGPCNDLRSFFLSNLASFPQIEGSGGTIYRFSTATVVGTIGPSVLVPEPVPEPASIVLLAPVVLALFVLRSRQPARRMKR
jgi:hypothetical protein